VGLDKIDMDSDGESDGLFEGDGDSDGDFETDGYSDGDFKGDGDSDGLFEDDGDSDGDFKGDGDSDGLLETDGDSEGHIGRITFDGQLNGEYDGGNVDVAAKCISSVRRLSLQILNTRASIPEDSAISLVTQERKSNVKHP
jgi:hypothetical protein